MAIDLRAVRRTAKVIDGAWGGELERLGCLPGCCREEWNLSHPERVLQVAASYVEAGSEIIGTNTFGANRFLLARHGLAGQVEAINRAGAQISRQAAGDRAWVFGSIGPSGKILMLEEVTEDDLLRVFAEQARALAAGGVDAIVCETMVELAESLQAVRAVKEATGLPVVASLTYEKGADHARTVMDTEVGEAAEALASAGADAVGCSCGVGISGCAGVVKALRQHTDLPVWVRPNAGLPEIQGTTVVYKETPDEFAARAAELLGAGANFIGGCCGTGPSHISRLAGSVRAWRDRC